MGMGHPTHAFDLDKIEGGIVVRLGRKGEKLKLLDGTEITLQPDDLVVADEKKPLALAGVMGGWDSMITPETKNILVEAAWFDPAAVRRSSRRNGLHTDASHRFERGADFNAAPVANGLVCELILQAGGKLEGELIDVIDLDVHLSTASRPPIELHLQQVKRHLGATIDPAGITSATVERYLSSLGCKLLLHGLDVYLVTLPSWRLDLEREIDLIEEIARVYGYNRFSNTLPSALPVSDYPEARAVHAIRTRLLELGYSEAISSTFASQDDAATFYSATNPGAPSSRPQDAKMGNRAKLDPSSSQAAQNASTTVALENPLSEEASLLRPSLIPGMLAMLANNLNRDVREARLFEQGHIFSGTTLADSSHIAEVHETPQLTLGITSAQTQRSPLYSAQDAPIFELKGTIESLLSLFNLPGGESGLSFSTQAPAWLEPGRSATAFLNSEPIAHFGELSQSQAQQRKLRQSAYVAQINLGRLYELPMRRATAQDLSRFQSVERDFSFTMPDTVQWHTISSALNALTIPELQSHTPVEIWRDAKKNPGVYSLLLRCVFQSHDRTLREEDLTAWSTRIIEALTKQGGTLRA
jgi:phenylalanyl-tRNA synthetase beta chain